MDNEVTTNKEKLLDLNTAKGKLILVALIVAAFFALAVVVGVVNGIRMSMNGGESPTTAQPVALEKSEESKPSTYNLRVSRGLYGVKITNNEAAELKDCVIKINNKYGTTTTLLPNEQKELVWTEFTDNGLKFDIDKNAVESVYVASCNSDNRLSSYDFTKS